MSLLAAQAQPSLHLRSKQSRAQYIMSIKTALELPQLMFRELDLNIPRVIQFGLQLCFLDGTYSL